MMTMRELLEPRRILLILFQILWTVSGSLRFENMKRDWI